MTHSGQTCIESRHALCIWLSALKDFPMSGMCTVYYVSSQCVEAQMRKLDHICVVFDKYIFKPKGHFCPPLSAPLAKGRATVPPAPPPLSPVLTSLMITAVHVLRQCTALYAIASNYFFLNLGLCDQKRGWPAIVNWPDWNVRALQFICFT